MTEDKYGSDGVKLEGTGWRDAWISEWHRGIGFDAPAVDIDSIETEGASHDGAWIEYDHRKPVALIEYKTPAAINRRGVEAARRAVAPIATLATMAGLPAYLVGYHSGRRTFRVWPLNEIAVARYDRGGELISERDYATLLYTLRGREIPQEVAERLKEVTEWAA